MIKLKLLLASVAFCVGNSFAQSKINPNLELPITVPPFLSGNFSELRSNHFHAGIDFKTQGRIGLPIKSVEDGWISRVVVSPAGYGNALYINHYNGLTSVYAHLDQFKGEIAQVIEDLQYEQEDFSVDTTFPKEKYKVNKGEIIALGGNSGSSGGPHLHFEIRETESEKTIDPLHFYKDKIKDTRAPDLRLIRIYPQDSAVVANHHRDLNLYPQSKNYNPNITAWGNIALGVKAYDRMDDVHNIFGVNSVRMFVNDSLYFGIKFDKMSFDKSRYINSLTDYADWINHRSMVMKLYRDPANELEVYTRAINDGIIDINEEKEYRIRFELSDIYGNTTTSVLNIHGKPTTLKGVKPKPGIVTLKHDDDNLFQNELITLKFDKGSVYKDTPFHYRERSRKDAYSKVFVLDQTSTPLHQMSEIKVKLDVDTLKNKNQYYLAYLNNGRTYNSDATYSDGYMSGRIKHFGEYVVLADKTKPSIKAINSPSAWQKYGNIHFTIDDTGSGIETFKGEIDGEYVLFKYDAKYKSLQYKLDPKRIKRNQKHHLKLKVTDATGNESVYEKTFFW